VVGLGAEHFRVSWLQHIVVLELDHWSVMKLRVRDGVHRLIKVLFWLSFTQTASIM
jgi:hypothetical protein